MCDVPRKIKSAHMMRVKDPYYLPDPLMVSIISSVSNST